MRSGSDWLVASYCSSASLRKLRRERRSNWSREGSYCASSRARGGRKRCATALGARILARPTVTRQAQGTEDRESRATQSATRAIAETNTERRDTRFSEAYFYLRPKL
eukprot:scaffold307751_cov32-Tisochrysis_lutea.AAC.2